VNLMAAVLTILLTAGASPTPADWSITPVFGPAVAAPGTTANPLLMPGDSSTSGYLITHTDAIHGPLDITASSSDIPSNFEDNLLVTVAVNGVRGQTGTLDDLLWHSGVVRATSALPDGPVMLTLTIELDPSAPPSTRLRIIHFVLSATVSDEVVSLPGQPSDPGGGRVPPLATTGQAISAVAILLGGSLLAGGLILVLRRRRRRPSPEIVQRAD
jgi:LPXTG-motif cell wall-anchored protein